MSEPYNSDEPLPFEAVEIIPLSVAILCLDCSNITRRDNSHCRSCGSESVLELSKILNRKEPTTP